MPSSEHLKNRLLAALPAATVHRWEPQFGLVNLKLGQLVYEPGMPMDYVYFPTTALVSLLNVLQDGSTAEIALVGRDGLVGMSLFMGGGATTARAVVNGAGRAIRLRAAVLAQEFEHGGPVMHLLLRYTQALMCQMTQTAVCNRHHSIDQQLCRWLLLSLDRVDGNELTMTQELIANMLGVRREGVSVAAARLQRRGLIHYSRGHITVVNRGALERHVCECYHTVTAEYERLLPFSALSGASSLAVT